MLAYPFRMALLWAGCFAFGASWLHAQQTTVYTSPEADFRMAQELFEKELYVPAQAHFRRTSLRFPAASNMRTQSEFYIALCAVELFNEDAEFLLTQFIHQHMQSHLAKVAYFHLGRYFFRDKKFKRVIEWMEQTDEDLLSDEQRFEYKFKLGYAYFKTEQFDKALPLLAAIKDKEHRYASAAAYYFGHIHYQNQRYEAALEAFNGLLNDESFGPIVPFYISQIYFHQKRFDQVIDFTKPILDSTRNKRAPELARMIGESYYNTQRYAEAVPYLEKFKQSGSNRKRDDDYQLAYAYFKLKNYEKAAENFERAAQGEDLLAQNAAYHLGWSYLELKNKSFARNSFQQAAKLNADTLIKEQALFNFAKTAYELSRDPFVEAIKALQEYIAAYPASERLDEAYAFLANIYTNTRNYRVALQSLDKIKNKNEDLKRAYQKVAYYRALELFNDKSYEEALRHFDLALQFTPDRSLIAETHYWKGDALYRLNRYDESIKAYSDFLVAPKAFDLPFFPRANYNIAYNHFKKKNYTEASIWFRKLISNPRGTDARVVADAMARTADCFLVQREFAGALEYYDKALQAKAVDADYIFYQRALIFGLQQKNDQKLKTLNALVSTFPQSKYIESSRLEIGKTLHQQNKHEEAYAAYAAIVNDFSGREVAAMASIQMALIRYEQRKNDEALQLYKNVVDKFPRSEAAALAALGIKRIYAETGRAVEYNQYAGEKGLDSMSDTEAELTTFEAAEKAYGKKDNCWEASPLIEKYLSTFSNSANATTMFYYQMDCAIRMKKDDKALAAAEEIIARAPNKFLSQALAYAAPVYRKDNPNKAEQYYKQLEKVSTSAEHQYQARLNLMRLSMRADDLEQAAGYADAVLAMDKVQDAVKNEARLIKGKMQLRKGDTDNGIQTLRKFAGTNSETGAEAQYLIAEAYHQRGEYARCEKEAYVIVDKLAGYDEWLVKALILLADNFVKLGNTYQAKVILQNIIDNRDPDALRKLAENRLNELKAQENAGKGKFEEIND